MLDKHDLLSSSLARLDDNVAAANGASGIPSIILQRQKNSPDPETDNESKNYDSSVISSKQEELSRLLCNSLQDLGEKTVNVARLDAEEREKTRRHERAENLRQGIDTLKAEKRRLFIEVHANKKSKAMVDILMEQIDEVKNDTQGKEVELRHLLGLQQQQGPNHTTEQGSTPQRNNRTPESAANVT